MMLEWANHLSAAFGPPLPPRRKGPPVSSENRALRLKKVLAKLAKHNLEGLRLFRQLPIGEEAEASEAKWTVISGSNRAGKTLWGCVQLCKAWLGCGVPGRYPPTGGNSLVVGRDLDHNGMFWRKCAEQGAFQIIRDEHPPHRYRAVRSDPNDPTRLDPYDLAYREKWKDAPPLIPPRMIAGGEPAWEDKRKRIPRQVDFTTGWRSLFRSSDGNPPQGDNYNIGLLDEDMTNPEFFKELARGLVGLDPKYKPRGIWTATAQIGNPELMELLERGASGSESVESFRFLIADNPYILHGEKQAFADVLSEDERETRILGIPAAFGRIVYPMFSIAIHTCEPFEIPENWTRFTITDYGLRHCGVLYIAVDPDEKHLWVYDGYDLQKSDAEVWARQMKAREGKYRYEAFIGDGHMGKEGRIGSGESVAQFYWEYTEKHGVLPRMRGSEHRMAGFFSGLDVIEARTEMLIAAMKVRDDGPFAGTPLLQIFRGRIPKLERQIKKAQYEDATKRPDRANKRKKLEQDLLDSLEYGVAFKPYYVTPEAVEQPEGNAAYKAFLNLQKKRERQFVDSY